MAETKLVYVGRWYHWVLAGTICGAVGSVLDAIFRAAGL